MPRKPRWYDAVPEATAVVDCGGDAHRVLWRNGKLVLEAHDLTAERTMLAFGGELCTCMRVLKLWADQFTMPPELFMRLHSWLGADAGLAPGEFDLPRRLGMILSWNRAWSAGAYLPMKQAQLLAAELKEKALPALRDHLNAWKARAGARVVSGCQVAIVPASQPPAIDGAMDGVAIRAVARLHGCWLIDVWPRGMATVGDAFVLAVDRVVAEDDLRVVAASWEPTGSGTWRMATGPARVRRGPGDGGAWVLEWEGATGGRLATAATRTSDEP